MNSKKKTVSSLKNHFLLAMPGLEDPNFSRSVVYLCEHTDDGAMGLIINQQMDEGQFINSNITFSEIEAVKKVLIKKLVNIYQLRIEYPN